MTHEATHKASHRGSAGLPAVGAIILTALWGAYTATVVFEIFAMPWPAYPG
ncbi:MAG: hypothetical protein AB7O98_17160 [Hyphomonadaceae bacterium]